MGESKHTPGPWRYDAGTDGRDRGYIRTEFGRESGGLGIAVARAVNRAELGPTAFDANARLIAAAPLMLEALQKHPVRISGEPLPDFMRRLEAWATKHLDPAIKAATGGET